VDSLSRTLFSSALIDLFFCCVFISN
jgi:hypothetical protein